MRLIHTYGIGVRRADAKDMTTSHIRSFPTDMQAHYMLADQLRVVQSRGNIF